MAALIARLEHTLRAERAHLEPLELGDLRQLVADADKLGLDDGLKLASNGRHVASLSVTYPDQGKHAGA